MLLIKNPAQHVKQATGCANRIQGTRFLVQHCYEFQRHRIQLVQPDKSLPQTTEIAVTGLIEFLGGIIHYQTRTVESSVSHVSRKEPSQTDNMNFGEIQNISGQQ